MSAATVETWEPGTPLHQHPDQIEDELVSLDAQFVRPMVELIKEGDAEVVLVRLTRARFTQGVCFRCEVTWGDPTAACWCCGNPGQVTR